MAPTPSLAVNKPTMMCSSHSPSDPRAQVAPCSRDSDAARQSGEGTVGRWPKGEVDPLVVLLAGLDREAGVPEMTEAEIESEIAAHRAETFGSAA